MFQGHPVVPLINPLISPHEEGITHNGVDDVGNIVSGQLLNLTLNGESKHDRGELFGVFNKVGQCQTLKLGYMQVFDLATLDELPISVDQVG